MARRELPEGFSQAEIGTAAAEARSGDAALQQHGDRYDRWLSIAEALLLSLVTVLAAYSGFAAAKWSTVSSVALAHATAERTQASRAESLALVTRTFDTASFNAWFTAFSLHNAKAEQLAVRRLRPGYRRVFQAWLATDPVHNPNAPPGPAYMPQYVIPQEAAVRSHDAAADHSFTRGESAGHTSDDYIQETVFLASVLFLVGISRHFRVRQARYGLIAVGTGMMIFSVVQLLSLPGPP